MNSKNTNIEDIGLRESNIFYYKSIDFSLNMFIFVS